MPVLKKFSSKHREAIQKILDFDNDSFEKVLSILKSYPISIKIEPLITKVVGEVENVGEDSAEIIFRFVISLYSLKRSKEELSIETVANDVATFAQRDISLSSEHKTLLENRLNQLMNVGGVLDIYSRAVSVLIENQRLLLKTRILTDLRPVFDSDSDMSILGAVLINTLKISYVENDEKKECFFSLDMSDIKDLKRQIERAEKKMNSLKLFLEETEVKYLNID